MTRLRWVKRKLPLEQLHKKAKTLMRIYPGDLKPCMVVEHNRIIVSIAEIL